MSVTTTCVYQAFESDELVATGRLTLERVPEVGDELRLNGRPHVVREVAYGSDQPVLTLVPR